MTKISSAKYVDGVKSIYVEDPEYKLGHDGSDGYCDCIGMCKGAIRRAGGDASGLSGTNYAARNTILDLRKVTSEKDLKFGDVVLKGRQPGESGYDLPDKYKSGTDLTDYYHIGTVTHVNPLEITHMTSPKAKIDTKLGKWGYAGRLPQVADDGPDPMPDPEPEPEPIRQEALVVASSGKNVNLRKSPSTGAPLVDRVPIGETVEVLTRGEDWCMVKWQWKTGWMMTKFLLFDDDVEVFYTVTISGLTKSQAEYLKDVYPDATISVG